MAVNRTELAPAPAAGLSATPPSLARLEALLAATTRNNASDLHLTPGIPPHLRVDGELAAIPGEPVLTPEDSEALALAVVGKSTAALYEALLRRGALDGAQSAPDGTRFRYNIFRRQNQLAMVFRRLEERFQSLSELGMPESLYRLCELNDGLVVISGATGSGKSTTIATLIDRINQTRAAHIVTIEDPIEYLHKPACSVINQRQVGLDAPTFNDALVSSLRQDPDVILVGEIRDLDTIRTAITAAETGHLVFTTLHAGNCAGAIERLVSVFPANEQDGVRRQLGLVARAFVSQHLLPAVHPGPSIPGAPLVTSNKETAQPHARPRRAAASEILFVNSAIANLIAMARTSQIYSAMETGQGQGMQTLEADLARLWTLGIIDEAVAMATARNPHILRDRAAALRARGQPAAAGGSR